MSVEKVADADEVQVTLTFPHMMEEQMEQGGMDITESSFSLFMGRSIKDMFEKRSDIPLPLLPKGIKVTGSLKAPSSTWNMITQAENMMTCGGFPECEQGANVFDPAPFFKGLASWTTNEVVLYKSEDEVKDQWAQYKADWLWDGAIGFYQSFPDAVRQKFVKLDQAVDGFKSMKMVGLPNKMEVTVEFTNWKMAEVIKAMLDAPAPPLPEWAQELSAMQ